VRSLANLVESLHEEFDFRIIAGDRDAGDSQRYVGVRAGDWSKVGNSNIYYVDAGPKSLLQIARILRRTRYDVLYLNSFFDPLFTFWPLLVREGCHASTNPLIIAPRGEFSSGALQIKKWKKSPYLAAARRFGLYSRALWQASSELEARQIVLAMSALELGKMRERVTVAGDILSTMSGRSSENHGLTVFVEPNVSRSTDASLEISQARAPGEALRVCFLSRISPMKNLKYALQVLSDVRRPVRFSIYGPKESKDYWMECERLIAALPRHVQATYCGVVEQSRVVETFAEHDLFFLPTRGENFGHVIHESLRAGTPVLVSDQTPWTELESRGIGVALPLAEPGRFARAIDDVADWDDKKRGSVRLAAQQYARSLQLASTAIEANRSLFWKAVSSRQLPAHAHVRGT
jgi:glycosyltransferase involved in cell wall biosynthesis